MPASTEVAVWLEKRVYDALEQALKESGTDSVEQETERLLRQRYEQVVSKEQREQIKLLLQREREQDEREREAARRYTAVRITEGGNSRYFEEDNTNALVHAYALRRHLRDEHEGNTLAQKYERYHKIEIDAVRFEQHQAAFGHSENLTGLYDINLDDGIFTIWHPETGQQASYTIKDISTAAYYAWRSSFSPYKYRERIFFERLAGKELLDAKPEQEDGLQLEM